MKILILSNIDAGLYKFRKELIEMLAKEHEVIFSTPDGDFTQKIVDLGCKFFPCKVLDRRSINPIKDIKLISYYNKLIKLVNPNIVLTYTIKPNIYGGLVCANKRIPYISNVTGLGTAIENGGILSYFIFGLYKIGLRKAKCVFFQNKANQEIFVKKKIISGKIRLIPGSGVNLKTNNIEPYPLEDQGIRFLFVGRIMKNKGIEELIRVMRKLYCVRKDIVLDVVGFCEENYSKLLNEMEREGIIINYGIQNDVHPFYTKSHCVILPSYHEGMSNVMLEAAATGRPVITTYVPGCKETFEEGVTGFGCEAKSVESLEKAVNRFIQISYKQREEMGKRGRKKMELEFDRNIIINAYIEEIDS